MAKKPKPAEVLETGLTTAVAAVAEFSDQLPVKGGRPKGSKTVDRPEAVLLPAQCPSCQSTRRSPFRAGRALVNHGAVEIRGQLFNTQIWRNTTCQDCGQRYRVIEYRNEAPA